VIPGSVPGELLLVRTVDVAVAIGSIRAYPSGFEFTVHVRTRGNATSGERGPGFDPGFNNNPFGQLGRRSDTSGDVLQLGVLYADGRRGATTGGFGALGGVYLMRGGSGGSDRRYDSDFWVHPLPPDGPVTFVAAWPEHGVAETRAELDAAAIHAAVARAVMLWPEEPSMYPGRRPGPITRSITFTSRKVDEPVGKAEMFHRFDASARKAIVLAQDQAQAFNPDHIGTEHLLLGVLYEDTGVAAQALGSLGVTFQGVRTAVAETHGGGQRRQGHIPFTPAAKTALELSLREADQLGHDWIGTEHLLLGVIAAADDGAKLLVSLTGLSSEELRRHVLDYLAAHPSPALAGMGELTFLTPGSVKHISLTAEQLSLIADAAIKAKTSIEAWITQRLLAAARDETSTDE
jgi:hypothetical protein